MPKIIYSLIALAIAASGMESSAQTISGKVGKHPYVDLGLPSGLKWATCNVGASKPTKFGDYFAWGEVKPKKEYNWRSYKWAHFVKITDNGFKMRQTKYCANSIITYNGETYIPKDYVPDLLKTLLEEDDAATANWGKEWRMPTSEEQQELIDGCDWLWTDDFSGTGVAGMIGTSKTNGNVIFLPASGFRMETQQREKGRFGAYWSSSLSMEQDNKNILNPSAYSMGLYLKEKGCITNWDDRFFGMNIRAVLK